MSKLTLAEIFRGYRNKDLDKSSTLNILRSVIENGDKDKLRWESFDFWE
ncbi:MAG: hypothetical protein ACFFAN_10510 [Promethearchaeota archaeon]